MRRARRPRGLILYEGPSWFDGSPIVIIATLKTANRKTGAVIQTWILRADMPPTLACKKKADYAICGSCPGRPCNDGWCYVNKGQAPESVYRAYRNGRYVRYEHTLHAEYLRGRMLRIGSYGDPAALPSTTTWTQYSAECGRSVGYTHSWRERPELRFWCMASTVLADNAEAKALGFRTFCCVPHDAGNGPVGSIQCLSETHKRKCVDCGLCSGSCLRGAKDVWIRAHGPSKRKVR